MAEQASFIIATLATDGVTAKGDKLTLIGRALPYQGFELEGSMRMETTWYPGNAVATIQMLGAEEKPTTIKGQWKDKFLRSLTDDDPPRSVIPTAVALLNEQALPDVGTLVLAVERMRLSGQLVKVTWGDKTRIGVMSRFKQNWIRFEDCEWELEFTWISRGEKQTPITSSVPPESFSFAKTMQGLVTNLQNAIANIVETANGVIEKVAMPFQVVEDFKDTVDAAANIIDDAAVEMTNAVTNATSLISAPQDAAARALAASESIKSAASTITTAVEGTPPLELIKSATREDLALGDALQADTYSRNIKAAARALQAFAASSGDELRASLDIDTLLAVFVARAPMDLRDVSQRYYDTPDEWRRLLTYNQLTTSALAIGALVLVPKLDSEDGRT